ncbi:metallophosphoesterase [Natrialba chahannaoensis JCM 10990]|uniref:Metallophosphoesterase n=1 Tax=Natrialba chahannaoensis JCM 10990 TaxID=1227492 RepID=M0A7I4_9EURY|nr:metallophosphoesterase [Natrialba chahannaoensis]ELY94321.1 metallophosphoesterase [Natrialba chahannaoensis JCM 10990]
MTSPPAPGSEPPFSVRSRAAFVPAAETLVIADLHLGRGRSSAIDAPIDAAESIRSRLTALLEHTGATTVVVAGDLLHAFDYVPQGVTESLAVLESTVESAGAALAVTPGNHDSMLPSVFEGEAQPVWEFEHEDEDEHEHKHKHEHETTAIAVCHGHEEPDREADLYVVGHDHPALSIEGRKRPCFLFGPAAYDGSDVLMLPAFTELAGGATVNGMRARDFQSPLVTDADAFHPIVWDDGAGESLWFPPLGECRRLL